LFFLYSEIIVAAASGSSLAPSAMLKYMLGCSVETSPAQPGSANNATIAAHARMIQVPKGFFRAVVACQPWLNGEGLPGFWPQFRRGAERATS
jgi:hypothetical protein